jgi:hypothetical protein
LRLALQQAHSPEERKALTAEYGSIDAANAALRQFDIGVMQGNVRESELRSRGKRMAGSVLDVGQGFLEAADAPGVKEDKEQRDLILQQGANEMKGILREIYDSGDAVEFNPLAESFAPDSGDEDVVEAINQAIAVLRNIETKIGAGVQ